MNAPAEEADSVAVIIAFYEKLRELELVLSGLLRQRQARFHIVIADDGSSAVTRNELAGLLRRMPFASAITTHSKEGWRKNRILNAAILTSPAERFLFIDGDVIPHRFFVRSHLEVLKEGLISTGRRVMMAPARSQSLDLRGVARGAHERLFGHFCDAVCGRGSHPEEGLYFGLRALRRWRNRRPPRGIVGCNFGVTRADLFAVNGFDMHYVAPGIGEDSDLEVRLKIHGAALIGVRNAAVQYHLHHERKPRPHPGGRERLAAAAARHSPRSPYGLDELRTEGDYSSEWIRPLPHLPSSKGNASRPFATE